MFCLLIPLSYPKFIHCMKMWFYDQRHGGESFSRNPGNNSDSYQKHIKTISYINQTYGGDLIFAPGDSNGGKQA